MATGFSVVTLGTFGARVQMAVFAKRRAYFVFVCATILAGAPVLAQQPDKKKTDAEIDDILNNPKNQVTNPKSRTMGCASLAKTYRALGCETATTCDRECSDLGTSLKRCGTTGLNMKC